MTYTVLDACCGPRMMWLGAPPGVLFGDVRRETIVVTDRSHGKQDGTRLVRVEPDVMMDFRQMPYPSNHFKLVVFDPPHLERAGPKSWMAAKYGRLSTDWRDDIRRGFVECFRVLEPGGVMIFKWNETHVKLKDVLELTSERPLFGQMSGKGGLTHWLVFMKAAPPHRHLIT